MKLSAAFFALVPLVAAMPPAARTVEAGTDTVSPKPNVLGNVFVCVDPNFLPPCAIFHGASGQCINFPPPFQHSISSVAPDPGQACFFFDQPNCVGRQLGPLPPPVIADLAIFGFDDVIMSFV
ncbi:hypothetical protein C8J57DRAFT_1731545 [Mycena rebaudengoi]|nr:hypothetical protein C8J57DRAFT_1731545 [Mycena rebaudengoi]